MKLVAFDKKTLYISVDYYVFALILQILVTVSVVYLSNQWYIIYIPFAICTKIQMFTQIRTTT